MSEPMTYDQTTRANQTSKPTRDLAQAGVVPLAGVGGAATDDELGAVVQRLVLQLVVVDEAGLQIDWGAGGMRKIAQVYILSRSRCSRSRGVESLGGLRGRGGEGLYNVWHTSVHASWLGGVQRAEQHQARGNQTSQSRQGHIPPEFAHQNPPPTSGFSL